MRVVGKRVRECATQVIEKLPEGTVSEVAMTFKEGLTYTISSKRLAF